jgi:hypothetical protein
MLRLERYLSYYTVRYLQHRRSQGISPDLKFVIDHSNNPGEGEVRNSPLNGLSLQGLFESLNSSTTLLPLTCPVTLALII